MEDTKKRNIFSRIIANIKNGFKGLDEKLGVDIPDSIDNLTREEEEELKRIEESDNVEKIEERYKGENLRKRLKEESKTDELKSKYGPAKPGNPIYDQAQRMNAMGNEREEESKRKTEAERDEH